MLLQATAINKIYSDKQVLENVSVSIPEGTVYGLLGPNGAGKTTLLRIINRIIAPDSGTITFKGQPLNASHVNYIGYLPEERGLYRKMKVGEQALYLSQLKGMSKNDAVNQLKYWFKRLEIASWWDKKVEELSKGMQQKVQFIITILHKPQLLIFDEPFSGFDPINANMLKKEIIELKKNGATIIFSTHNMGSVEELCDEITLINKSKTVLNGPVEKIKQEYKQNIFQCLYSGNESKINLLDNNRYEMVENVTKNGTSVCRIRIKDQSSENNLLSDLIKLVEVKSFSEIIPSMDEIFVSVVNSSQN